MLLLLAHRDIVYCLSFFRYWHSHC